MSSISATAAPTTGGIYSAEQIRIPPELPEILKNYAKFIIKTQPVDIITASSMYFSKLATQGKQAGKDGKLTNSQLATFLKKFSVNTVMATKREIQDACEWADVSETQRQDTLTMGNWTADQVPWMPFWAYLVASSAGSFMATLNTAIMIGSENGMTQATLVRVVFEFLVAQDAAISKKFVQEFSNFLSTCGNAVQTEKITLVVAEFWESKDLSDEPTVEKDIPPTKAVQEPAPDAQETLTQEAPAEPQAETPAPE